MVPRTEEFWHNVKPRPQLCRWSCSRPWTRAWLQPTAGTAGWRARIWYLAALAWEFLFILEFFPSPHLLHSACRKPNFSKSTKTTETSSAMDTPSRKRHICASTQSWWLLWALNQAWEHTKGTVNYNFSMSFLNVHMSQFSSLIPNSSMAHQLVCWFPEKYRVNIAKCSVPKETRLWRQNMKILAMHRIIWSQIHIQNLLCYWVHWSGVT